MILFEDYHFSFCVSIATSTKYLEAPNNIWNVQNENHGWLQLNIHLKIYVSTF
jgi:hypothetical protein